MNRNNDFENVMHAHWADVYRLSMLMFDDENEAEEVAQQTFFKAYKAWDSFEGRSSVRTWLFRIAINACRRNITIRRRFQGERLGSHLELAHPENDPREELMKENVRQALKQLAPPHRLILTLFCIDGLRHQDIARIFNVPEGTVWSRLHKAKQELAKELESIKG